MGKLFCLVGKSGSGKDTLFKSIVNDTRFSVTPVIPYTTRPRRKDEKEGIDYHFVTPGEMQEMERNNEIIEKRAYDTTEGVWFYFTKSFSVSGGGGISLMITTPEALGKLAAGLGSENIVVLLLDADGRIRIERSLQRESEEEFPNYSEVCRRYLADEKDFAVFTDEAPGQYYGFFAINADGPVEECLRQFEKIYSFIQTNLVS